VQSVIHWRSITSCKAAWKKTQKPLCRSNKSGWKQKEDEKLGELVERLGTKNWTEIAKKLNEAFKARKRNGRQCRDRWLNCVNPEIKRYL